MALVISTWLWGTKYGPADVLKLIEGVKRHLKQPYRFLLMSDRYHPELDGPAKLSGISPKDADLLKVRGCFARLRMFQHQWQKHHDIDDRLVCMDLDTVITGPLDHLFDRPEPFVILQGANAANPCPLNGSLMMLRAGAHPEVWSDFSLEAAQKVPFYEFPDDQGWLWHKVPDASGWKCGPESGVYAFEKPGWPKSGGLPADARMVVFPGWRSPQQFRHLSWIKQNWTAEAA